MNCYIKTWAINCQSCSNVIQMTTYTANRLQALTTAATTTAAAASVKKKTFIRTHVCNNTKHKHTPKTIMKKE